jgi:hypothetical protein
MSYDDLIDYYGSEAKAGAARGLPRQTVHRWKGREIPLDQQVAYEVATKGVLKADLPASIRRAFA